MTASEASASGHGRLCTVRLQRRQAVSPASSPRAARARARRPGRTTFGPKRPSIAGSSVSDASRTISTASTEAIARPYRNATPVANMPNSAIITVVPASRTARPDVSIDAMIDASTSPVSSYASLKRVTMNSA